MNMNPSDPICNECAHDNGLQWPEAHGLFSRQECVVCKKVRACCEVQNWRKK